MHPVRLAIGVVVLLGTSSLAPAQTTIRWKWNPGEKLAYVLRDECKSNSRVDQEFFEIAQALTLDTTWHVRTVGASGEAAMVVTIERVRFTADGNGAAAPVKIRFDSKDAKEPQS